MNREDLIKLTENAVVPYQKWNNRDSYSAQVNIQDIYCMLSAGIDYDLKIEKETINISFKNMTREQYKKTDEFYLNIDSRENYFEEFGNDNEMFDCYSRLNNLKNSDWSYEDKRNSEDDIEEVYKGHLGGYLPTRERLNEVDGEDWY